MKTFKVGDRVTCPSYAGSPCGTVVALDKNLKAIDGHTLVLWDDADEKFYGKPVHELTTILETTNA